MSQVAPHVQIGQEIHAQLGGSRFAFMTGATQFVALSAGQPSDSLGGLQFNLPRNFAQKGINKVRIFLDQSDTYTVEALKVDYKHHTFEVVESSDLIYADNLQETFTRMTGLDTHL